MRRFVLLVALLTGACAPKSIPPPLVTTPKFPEFGAPTIPAALTNSPVAAAEMSGWAFLQAGDLKSAERQLSVALTAAPDFYPAEAALGYVELARKDPKAALPHFDRALAQNPAYVSALVGKGRSLVSLNRDAEAVTVFEAATSADPSLADLKRQVEVMKFRVEQQNLDAARKAARAGRTDDAVRMYTTALAGSPDSPFLYRELAAVERQRGDLDRALEHFRKAVALDSSDAKSLEQIGEILEERQEFDAAVKAYGDSIAVEPNAAVEDRFEAVRNRLEFARLPEEYRALDQAPQITRGDLAALIGIRLAPLLQSRTRRDAVLITDVRSHWAATWIMSVARAGVMDPFANHAFQPHTIVRRSDLAQAVARLLLRMPGANPSQAKAWESARLKFADLAAGHLAYPAASVAVASGVMKVGPDNAFQPSRPVTGAEAIDAIDRLAAMAGVSVPKRGQSRQ